MNDDQQNRPSLGEPDAELQADVTSQNESAEQSDPGRACLGEEAEQRESLGEDLTPQEQAEAREYGRANLVCDLLDTALDIAYLGVVVLFLATVWDNWLASFGWLAEFRGLRVVAMFSLVTALHFVVSFPLSYYSGFLLEHKYHLSRQSLRRWLFQYSKRVVLTFAFGALTFAGLFYLIWQVGPWWWLVAAILFFFISIVLGQLLPVVILPLFHPVKRLEEETLLNRLRGIAEGTGMKIEGVYRLELSHDTVKANAMLAGLGKTRRVLLGDTLLASFTEDEIEVIFGHEIGHHVFRHIPKMIATGALLSLLGFWLCDLALRASQGGEFEYAQTPVAALPLLMLAITIFSTLMGPVQNTISRYYERQCDRYALEVTNNRAAYISAFRKLARLNKADLSPHPLEVFLLHDHPPLAQRIAVAE